jgi:triphosphoribosyl-dephospho-CoA synthase
MAIGDVAAMHLGGNTHLGSSLLLVPLAASAGKTFVEKGMMNFRRLRDNVETLMRTTTPKDAVEVYEAIRMAGDTEQLGKWSGDGAPDVYAEGSEDRLVSARITLYEAMKTASGWDTIASEWANGMKVSFGVGYPTLVDVYARTGDINTATVHTYMTILSTVPDTFIARKVGLKEVTDISKAVEVGREKTLWISEIAGNILKVGGLTTPEGREAMEKLDDRLHQAKGLLNPGTSADLTASSLMIALLCGLKF